MDEPYFTHATQDSNREARGFIHIVYVRKDKGKDRQSMTLNKCVRGSTMLTLIRARCIRNLHITEDLMANRYMVIVGIFFESDRSYIIEE